VERAEWEEYRIWEKPRCIGVGGVHEGMGGTTVATEPLEISGSGYDGVVSNRLTEASYRS
jgi:hypothetical protein